jgi:Fe-S-cluster containining protein
MYELEGKSYDCLNGCGMCCLCQPELSNDELKVFETDPYLRDGLTRDHIDGRKSAKANAIKLQGGCGACHFLKNRICTIHEIKPRFCRQFPVHVHLLRRAQLSVNLSCRGISEGGQSLKAYGKALFASIPEKDVEEDFSKVKEVVTDFDGRCKEAGVYQTPERLRSVATKALPIIAKQGGTGKLLAFADSEPAIGKMPDSDILNELRGAIQEENLDQLASESNYEQFEIEDIAKLPVYVDEHMRWNLIQSRDGKINWIVLQEDGTMQLQKSMDVGEISLLPFEKDGLSAFADYARVLIGRDAFMGSVYSICNQHRYRHDLMTVYLGVLGNSLLDLWWRASLLGKVGDMKRINRTLATEGVRAYDMDSLDAPTVGAFI